MNRRPFFQVLASLIFLMVVGLYPAVARPYSAKIAVFNFNLKNLEARGYDATVTNMLINYLERSSSLNILNRKDLEAFLALNDLQQNDELSNVINIGNRLGLDMIIAGNVEKERSVIKVECKVAKITEKTFIFNKRLRSFGDAGLREEIRLLSLHVSKAIESNMGEFKSSAEAGFSLDTPKGLTYRPASSKIILRWENVQGSSGFKIFRSLSEDGPFTKIAQISATEYFDEDLEKNTEYYYKIKAFDKKGRESDPTLTLLAETSMTPNPPIILSIESHLRSIRIIWSPSPVKSEDLSKLLGYKLYRAKTQEGPYLEVANLLGKDLGLGIDTGTTLDKLFKIDYLDKELADGEKYYYRVGAYNEKNLESDLSTPMEGKCIPIVKGVHAQGDMIRKIKISWNVADSDQVQGYYLYRSISEKGGFTKIKKLVGRENNSFMDENGLKDKTTYYYRVSLFEDNNTEGSMSDVVSAVTKGPPPIPRGLKVESGIAKKVKLLWDISPQEEVRGYKLYRSEEREGEYRFVAKIENRSQHDYLDSGTYEKPLEDNFTYYYRMTSYNKVDVESAPSETVSATTKPRPVKPAGLSGESLHVKEIPLKWEPNPEDDIIGYHIFRSFDEHEKFHEIEMVKENTSLVDKSLEDGKEYRYKMQAEDRDGLLSDFSRTITICTKPRPRSPRGLEYVIRGGEVVLTWTPNSEPDIISYNVFEKGFFGLKKIETVKDAKSSMKAPKPGKSKDFAVTAIDRDGLESDPSKPITVFGKQ